MRFIPSKRFVAVMALSASVGSVAALAQTSRYSGIGTPPTDEDRGNLAWTSGPSGKDLPPGKGTAKQGTSIYMNKCVMCHGKDAEGVRWSPGSFSPIAGVRLGGGNTTPRFTLAPGQITTMAYAVPWATPIFNAIAVEMPFLRPGTLTADEVYALTAFVLFKNGIVKEDEVMDSQTLPKIQMPNHNSFPASDEIYMDMKKRGCIQTYGICRDK